MIERRVIDQYPIMVGLGNTGDMWYQTSTGVWAPIAIGPESSVLNIRAGVPVFDSGPTNLLDVGMGVQFGDGINSLTAVNLQGYLEAPWAGTLTRISLVANVSCSCVVDVKRNGVSIFATTTKPTLSSATTYTNTTLANVVTTVAETDSFLVNLDSVSGAPARITLILYVRKT